MNMRADPMAPRVPQYPVHTAYSKPSSHTKTPEVGKRRQQRRPPGGYSPLNHIAPLFKPTDGSEPTGWGSSSWTPQPAPPASSLFQGPVFSELASVFPPSLPFAHITLPRRYPFPEPCLPLLHTPHPHSPRSVPPMPTTSSKQAPFLTNRRDPSTSDLPQASVSIAAATIFCVGRQLGKVAEASGWHVGGTWDPRADSSTLPPPSFLTVKCWLLHSLLPDCCEGKIR